MKSGSTARARFFRLVPAFDSLRTYSKKSLALDTMAGLTVAAVAVPQAMAYAQVAGIPAQYGLYTAIVMTAVGALFDSSRLLINGPTNAISIAVLSSLVGFSDGDRVQAAILLTLLVGAIQLGITLMRLGDLSRYISHAVIVGFTIGAAILLVLDQLKNLLGLPGKGAAEDHFLKRFWLTMEHFDQTNKFALLIGLATVAVALGLRWVNNRLRIRLPELLLAVIGMAAVVWTGSLDEQGVKIVGDIPARLPHFEVPHLDLKWVSTLAGSSFAVALLGLLEAISMAKVIASKTGLRLDINQQCLSEGVANLAGSVFQCFPGSGSLTRSTINQQAGARTQCAGIISAVVVALTVMLFAKCAYYIPRSALAGILMLSAWRLVDRHQASFFMRTTRADACIVVVTALAAVVVSVEFCVLIGVLMSFILYIPKAARLQMTELTLTVERVVRERLPEDPPCGRIRIFSMEGDFFFGAAVDLEKHLDTITHVVRDGVRVVVLRLKRVRNPDGVCLQVLERFVDDMHAAGVTVLMCALRPDLMKIIKSSGLERHLGSGRVFVFQDNREVWSSTLDAIRFAYEIVKDDVCATCPRHGESLMKREGWQYAI